MQSKIARSIAALSLVALLGLAFAQQPSASAAIVKLQAAKGLARDVELGAIDKPATATANGIGIAAAHVEYETESRHYAHIDMPAPPRADPAPGSVEAHTRFGAGVVTEVLE